MKTIWALALGAVVFNLAAPALAQGNPAAGKAKAQMCAGCHGPDGNSMVPMFPKLAGLGSEYIVKQLMDFKSGARKNPQMSPMAAPLSKADMQDIAAYYDQQEPTVAGATADKETLALGQKLYRGGDAKNGVSACMSCHGPSGHGIPPRYPRVSGQHAAYTEQQLMDFKNNRRTNDDGVMTRIVPRMTDAQIKAVAQYMAGLTQANP